MTTKRQAPAVTHAADAMVPQTIATRVNWVAVTMFVVISFGLLWLIEIPVFLTGGIAPGGEMNPLFFPLTVIGMFTPAIAAVIVTLTIERPKQPGRFLGLVPLRPWGRLIRYSLLGFVAPWVIGVLMIIVAAAAGVVPLQISYATVGLLLSIPLASFITAFAAFGEELGWRGYLLPALAPLGTWPALILNGVIWGVWHASVILMGYNYNTTNPVAVVFMTITTVLLGMLFGWLRMRSGSVYPASFAHGALNGSSGVLLAALLPAGAANLLVASPLGWVGWIVAAVIVATLVIGRSFRWAPQAAPKQRPIGSVAADETHG